MSTSQSKELFSAGCPESPSQEFLTDGILLQALMALLDEGEKDNGTEKYDQVINEASKLFRLFSLVVIATKNPIKCKSAEQLVSMLIPRDQDFKFGTLSTGKEEPDIDNAAAVAFHKVQSVVDRLIKEVRNQGGNSLVLGTDVVVRVNGEHLMNLSRVDRVTGDILTYHKENLKRIYSKKGEVILEYDVALAFSAKVSGKVYQGVVGNRIVMTLDRISDREIDELFHPNNISKLMGINAGLPIVDGFYGRVKSIKVYDLANFYEDLSRISGVKKMDGKNAFKPHVEGVDTSERKGVNFTSPSPKGEMIQEGLELMIRGGIPTQTLTMLELLVKAFNLSSV